MNVAYVSLDEVHQDLACRMARASGVKLGLFWPDEPLPRRLRAVVYDLDYLPIEYREGVLATLVAGPSPSPVAVHGYNLTGKQKSLLRRNGVVVRRRLGPSLFRAMTQRTAAGQLSTT